MAEEFGQIFPETEKKHMIERTKPLPDGWWKDVEWINLKDHEPTLYELLFDYFINKMASDPDTVMQTSLYPPRSILIVTKHPKRGVEYTRFRLSPATVVQEVPEPGSNIEVDAIVTFRSYYTLVRALLGEIPLTDAVCDGTATVIGNFTALMDLRDSIHTAQHKDSPYFKLFAEKFGLRPGIDRGIPPRPLMWPHGHP